MKKFIFAILFALSFVSMLNAQSLNKAIGLRFGYDLEASFQMAVGSNSNRIELDLGTSDLFYFNNHFRITLTGAYHWVFNIAKIQGFNWFIGPAAQVNLYGDHNYFAPGIGLGAQGGVEYNFKFPLQVSADYRPMITWIFHEGNGFYPYSLYGFALSARYKF